MRIELTGSDTAQPAHELTRQESFPGLCPIADAVDLLATAGGIEARGAIYTRPEVVEFLLNLAGYTTDKKLHQLRLLEPAFGGGDFLLAAIRRLLDSWIALARREDPVQALGNCVRAVELHRSTFAKTRLLVIDLLKSYALDSRQAMELADLWLINGDFLLVDLDGEFDVVVGNPPYVRQELIPDILLKEYRNRYATVYDRADLYIPFIERSLYLLVQGGELGFICSDRWMKNRYGGPLRKLVAEKFHLKVYVDMVGTAAFQSDVIAYPAITVISRNSGKTTSIAFQPTIEHKNLAEVADALLSPHGPVSNVHVGVLDDVVNGGEPWILDSTGQLAVIRRLESKFRLLEETGCKVGIGVATGADKAFIGPFDDLDVEECRKLPLVMTKDIQQGTVHWRGLGVINPFAEEGGLVDLAGYPRLRHYLEARKDQIAGRHCAQKAPANWYRTIDRITPEIASQPKLLIPDIKGKSHIVYEEGLYYPHHNLYYITSENWNLKALQAVLLSCVTRLFIATYSTKMQGGFLRFQAQYLRRLRLPDWDDVPDHIRTALISAADKRDIAQCDQATFALYGLSNTEIATIHGNRE